jgi:hypothetical protein
LRLVIASWHIVWPGAAVADVLVPAG